MSKKHRKWTKEQHRADHDKPPSDHAEDEATVIYTVKSQPHPDEDEYRKKQIGSAKTLNVISGIGVGLAGLTLVALVVYACITYGQLGAMLGSNKLTRQSLNMSQGAYVTIGRKDGVVADVVVPKDPKANAEIVIYFQNSGHLPATFTWGTMAALLAAGSKKKSTGITLTHPYKGGISRTRNKKDGSIQEQGGDTIIAGDSVFVSTLGVISQKDLADLPANNMGDLILGMFEYCDELGTHSTRQFGLVYRSNAPSSSLSFTLANDSNVLVLPLPKSTATTEYLPPCETSAEREQNQDKKPN